MPELEFRDGKRGVPEHVEELLRGVPTYKLTYSEALEFMNRRLQFNYVENVHSKIVSAHFRRER
jgi:hypothetical protein